MRIIVESRKLEPCCPDAFQGKYKGILALIIPNPLGSPVEPFYPFSFWVPLL